METLENLSPEDEETLTTAIAEAIVRREEREAAETIARWDGFRAGRAAGLAERPHRPESHDAETRRKLHDLALAREVAKVADDPEAHPLRRLRLAQDPPLSQAELGALVGVTSRCIHIIEAKNGRAMPRTRSSIAAALGVDPRTLGIELR